MPLQQTAFVHNSYIYIVSMVVWYKCMYISITYVIHCYAEIDVIFSALKYRCFWFSLLTILDVFTLCSMISREFLKWSAWAETIKGVWNSFPPFLLSWSQTGFSCHETVFYKRRSRGF